MLNEFFKKSAKVMVATSKRTLWKGAISFGLAHIPIALHPATSEQALNFDWLDKRSINPVGYKRNKAPRSKLRGIIDSAT